MLQTLNILLSSLTTYRHHFKKSRLYTFAGGLATHLNNTFVGGLVTHLNNTVVGGLVAHLNEANAHISLCYLLLLTVESIYKDTFLGS